MAAARREIERFYDVAAARVCSLHDPDSCCVHKHARVRLVFTTACHCARREILRIHRRRAHAALVLKHTSRPSAPHHLGETNCVDPDRSMSGVNRTALADIVA